MAETLGAIASCVTLAALFKTCIEAFDIIEASRHQKEDLRKLKLRLDIEKCRLYVWGESMGLTDALQTDQERLIDQVRFPEVVREILEALFDLFNDSHKIREDYGCRQATSEDLLNGHNSGTLRNLAAPFSNFLIRSSPYAKPSKIIKNLRWVIQDRKKFSALVADIKYLIDSLHGITSPCVPVARQQGKMRRKIVEIGDAETLSLIAEVCQEDHPDVADVASTKADTMSMASSQRKDVAAWVEDVEEIYGNPEERMSPDVESLTVAELKQKLLEMYQERKQRNALSSFASEPPDASSLDQALPGSASVPGPATNAPNISPIVDGTLNDSQNPPRWIGAGRPYLSSTASSQHFSALFTDAPDPTRGMVALSQDLTTLSNSYGPTGDRLSSVPSSPSYDNSYSAGWSGSESLEDVTYNSSITSSTHRTLPRPQPIMGQSIAGLPPPQSMFGGSFNSKISSTSQKKHKCKICDKRFTRPTSLTTHMYSHTGEKPYSCDVEGCGRHFSVVSNLRRHKKVHKAAKER